MGNSFRVDRVGMEIKREVNEILQRKFVTHVCKMSLSQMYRCLVICQLLRFFTLFIQPWPQITKKHKLVLKRLLGQSSVNLVKIDHV